MPIDFGAMNDRVKTAHDQAQSEKQAKAEEVRRAADEQYAKCVAVLKEYVVPHLEQAAYVFKSQGIDARIKTQFDVRDNPRVLLEFYYASGTISSYVDRSRSAVFVGFPLAVSAGVAKLESSNVFDVQTGRAPADACEPLIEKVVGAALAEYYKTLQSRGLTAERLRQILET